jgi:alpha-glucosidase
MLCIGRITWRYSTLPAWLTTHEFFKAPMTLQLRFLPVRMFVIALLAWAFLLPVHAQHKRGTALADLTNASKTSHGVVFTTSSGTMELTVYTPTVIRVHCTKAGQKADKQSYAVIQEPAKVSFTLAEETGRWIVTTDSVRCVVRTKPLRIAFETTSGVVINEDEPAFGTMWIGEEVTTYKKIVEDEKFIGLGEKTGPLNRRGEGYTNWNTDFFGYPSGADPIYLTTPMYIGLHASKGKNITYGIFMDNSYKSHFNFGASNDRFSSFTAEDGDMNYYFIANSSVAGIIASYTELTGRMEMPPLWSLGFQQCRYSYYPDKEVLRVAQTFREKKIPADVIYLDIHYMDAYKIFTWHPERFPQPKKMLDDLELNGFKTVVIVDPGIKVEKGYSSYEQGKLNNLFLKYPDGSNYTGQVWPGWCHFPDFTNPATRTWWGESFQGYGGDGFWNDMNEPATWGQRFPELVEFDFDGNIGTHRKGHNLYGMQMARATYEGTKKLLGGKRPFILTRAGYSGVQRYSAVWTGDNTSSDDHMMAGVRLTNSMGLTGMPFVGMDIGGFTGNPSSQLFARWITIGAFQPLFRAHVAIDNKDQEPWSFGERVEEISRNYIQLRYNLMPYIYSLFHEASKTGMPVQRSLAIDYAFDNRIYDWAFSQQFMLGPSIMVCPQWSGQDFCKVLLPKTEWYSLHTLRPAQGDVSIVESPIEKLPVFIKGGAIIPMQSPVQNLSKDKPSDTLSIYVYYGSASGEFTYYEDDGATYEYQQGSLMKRRLVFDPAARTFTLAKPEGSYASKFKAAKIMMIGFASLKAGASVRVNSGSAELQGERVNFLQPISNFDPIGKVQINDANVNALSVVVPFGSQEVTLSW